MFEYAGPSPSSASTSGGGIQNPLHLQSYTNLHPYGMGASPSHGMTTSGAAISHPSFSPYGGGSGASGAAAQSYPMYSHPSPSSSVLTNTSSMYGGSDPAFSPGSGAGLSVTPSHSPPSSPVHLSPFGSHGVSLSPSFGFGSVHNSHSHSHGGGGGPVSHPFLIPSTPPPSSTPILKLPALANISSDAPSPVYIIVSEIWASPDNHWEIRGVILGSEEPRFMSDKNLLLSDDDLYLLVARWGSMFAQLAPPYRCFTTASECLDCAKQLKLLSPSVSRLEEKNIWMVQSKSFLSTLFERMARFHSLDQADVKRIEPLMQQESIAPFFHHEYVRSLCCSKPAFASSS